MTHFLLTDNTKIKKNRYNIRTCGIEVPSHKIDVVLYLFWLSTKGHRVGYGKVL
jgi:5-formyltetrahydrofolate cyclo-ligase